MTKKDEDKKRDDPYALKDIFVEMEMDLVRSFHRNLVKHRLEEQEAGFSWEMWQVAILRNIEQYRKENKQIINGYRPAVKAAVEKVLNYRYEQGRKNVEKMAQAAKIEPSAGQIDLDKDSFSFPQNERNTALPGQTPPQETQFFGVNGKKLKVLINSVTSDMEDASNAIYRKMDDVYRQTIFKAEMQLSTGAISLYQAIDKATEEFLAKGLDCIVYKGGRHVNVATYAEMALRTAYQRAGFLGEGAKRDEYGNHLIVVSTHPNCCNLCFPWQGQILIDDVFSHPSQEYMEQYKSKYKLLSSAIKAGLMHPNCRHTLATWFEGVSRLPKIYDEDEAKKNYEAEQKQRALENAIRKAKRQKAGATDEDNKKDAAAKLRALRSELKKHLEKNPQLKRNPYREKTEPAVAKLGNGKNNDPVESNGRFVETIDMKDVDKYIEKYENEIKDYPIEHAYIIYEDGKVMHYVGTNKGVSIPSTGIKNAIIMHNHPVDPDIDANCFGADDFGYLQACGLKINKLRATYDNLRYEVKVLKDLSQISFSEYRNKGSEMIDITVDFIDMDENAYRLLAEEGYIDFTKTKTET